MGYLWITTATIAVLIQQSKYIGYTTIPHRLPVDHQSMAYDISVGSTTQQSQITLRHVTSVLDQQLDSPK